MAAEGRAYANFQLFTNFVHLFSQFDWPKNFDTAVKAGFDVRRSQNRFLV